MPGAFKALYNGGRAGEGIQLLGVGGGGYFSPFRPKKGNMREGRE